MKRTPWVPFLALCALALVAFPPDEAFAQGEGEDDDPIARLHEKAKERRDSYESHRKELRAATEAEMRQDKDDVKKEADHLMMLKEDSVESNDVSVNFTEPEHPRDVTDFPPKSYIGTGPFKVTRHEIWSLRPEDFRCWKPARVKIERPLMTREAYEERNLVKQTERLVFRDVFIVLQFALTNSTDKQRLLGPRLWMVSEHLRFTPEIGGFIAKEDVEQTVFRDLASTGDLTGYVDRIPRDEPTVSVLAGSGELPENVTPVQAIQAGETRYGVAVFPLSDLEMDTMTVVVEGLNNTYRFDRRQKKVLVITFDQLGDEFYPFREPIDYRGKGWQWLWMWYEELELDDPMRYEIETPTGGRKFLWAYTATLRNSSRQPQELEIRTFNTILPVEIEPPGFGKKVKVDVEFVDNGESTIHKERVMKKMAQPFRGERFFSGTLEPDDIRVFPVIFNEEDIAWEKVYEQVEWGLTWDEEKQRGISIGYGEPPLGPGFNDFLPDPAKLEKAKPVRLDDDQKEQVRDAIVAALPEAFARRLKADRPEERRLIADVTAISGIASGTFRIVRSLFTPGVISADWIQKWEE